MSREIITPVIAVPARNEEKHLPLLFAALASQSWQAKHNRQLEVVVVLNNCTDDSRGAVLAAIARYPSLAIRLLDVTFDAADAHVGNARRLAMETALATCSDPARTTILTTDADAAPRADWISANLRHITDGIDIVGGLIVGNPAEEEKLGPKFNLRARLHQRYCQAVDHLCALLTPLPHDPWPRHHDHTGASLAVRADVYKAVGGLPPVPFREDIALVERVRHAGYRIRHPLDVVVEVSARLEGRAPGGMADCLKTWMREAAAGEPLLVEHPEEVLKRITLKAIVSRCSVSSPKQVTRDGKSETIRAEEAIEMLTLMIERAGGKAHAM